MMTDLLLDELRDGLDRESPVPLYHQLAQSLERLIETGDLPAGLALPGNIELGNGLNLNIGTIQKAYGALSDKGLVERRRRLGTVVCQRAESFSHNVGFYYFAENAIHAGRIVERLQRRFELEGYDLKVIAYERDFYQKVDLVEDTRRRQLRGAIFVALNDPECLLQFQPGATCAATIDGTLNDDQRDKSWTVEVRLPWRGIDVDRGSGAWTFLVTAVDCVVLDPQRKGRQLLSWPSLSKPGFLREAGYRQFICVPARDSQRMPYEGFSHILAGENGR